MTQEEPVKVLVAVGEGSEEIETISVVDVLRRAGAEVTLASVSKDRHVKCSRGVELVADKIMEEIKEDTEYDCIVCPGGMPGATNLAASKELQGLLQKHSANGRAVLAAICAAPAVIFEPLGFLKTHKATCHPAFADRILSAEGGCSEERVVVSNNNRLVTSRGPGTSIEFALKLVELLFDIETAKKVCTPMMTHL